MPPRTEMTSEGCTPWSSANIARAQTMAVSGYSGMPMRLTLRPAGVVMPLVRLDQLCGEAVVADALGAGVRGLGKLGVGLQRVVAGVHPIDGLTIRGHEFGERVLLVFQNGSIRDQHTDGSAVDDLGVVGPGQDADLALFQR